MIAVSVLGAAIAGLASGEGVTVQNREPPVINPRPGPQAQSPVPAMEDLVRQGYEVKAMQQYGAQPGAFIVLLQRSGDVRSCLMRIERQQGQPPVRRTVCF